MWFKGGKMRIIADERVAQLASFDFQLNFTVDECFALTFSSLPIFNHPLSLCLYPLRNLITFAHAAHRRKWLSVETLNEVQLESWVRSFVDEEKVEFNFSYLTCAFFIVARSHINLACTLTDSRTTRVRWIWFHYTARRNVIFPSRWIFSLLSSASPTSDSQDVVGDCDSLRKSRIVKLQRARRGRFLRSKKLSGKSSTFSGNGWRRKAFNLARIAWNMHKFYDYEPNWIFNWNTNELVNFLPSRLHCHFPSSKSLPVIKNDLMIWRCWFWCSIIMLMIGTRHADRRKLSSGEMTLSDGPGYRTLS